LEAYGARVGALSGKDGVILLDFPEYRGLQTIRWTKVSDSVGLKIGLVGYALNKHGITPDYSGNSGAAEGFLKQVPQLERQNISIPKWGNISLGEYPFSKIPFVNVAVPGKLVNNSNHIINIYYDLGKWSNTLQEVPGKVTNIELSGLRHGEFNDELIRGNPNPAFPLVGAVHQNRPFQDVRDLAQVINTSPSLSSQKTVIEPFFGASGKTMMFGKLPELSSYYEPKELGIMASKQKEPPVYDRIVQPFDYLGLIGLMQQSISIAGALKGLEGNEPTNRRFDPIASPYAGGLRLRVEKDGTYALYTFSPRIDKKGQLLSSDPIDITNWRLLSKDEAIDRLHNSLSYQYQTHKSTDPTYESLFSKTSDFKWSPLFSYLNPPHDPKFSEIMKIAEKEPTKEVLLNFGRERIHTTYSDFLKANIPMPGDKLEKALSYEYAVTQQFRQATGQDISFRHWMEGGGFKSSEAALPSVSPFKDIGASSFGKRQLANVWHWNASNLPSEQIVQETSKFAKNAGVEKIAILDYGAPNSKDIQKTLQSQGFEVELIPRTQRSLTDPTVIGMGLAMSIPEHRSIVISIEGKVSSQNPVTLIKGDNPLSKIPSLGQDISGKEAFGKPIFVLKGQDLSSRVLNLHLKDYGFKPIPVPPAPEILLDFSREKVVGIHNKEILSC